MIYIDTSVVLAQIFAEDRKPPASLWTSRPLMTSRLLEYEVRVRLHTRRLAEAHRDAAERLVASFGLVELTPPVLARALDPFPVPLRTLDALHLASMTWLREQGQDIQLASYDRRRVTAARAMEFPIFDLNGAVKGP